jgi:hypothetical protein
VFWASAMRVAALSSFQVPRDMRAAAILQGRGARMGFRLLHWRTGRAGERQWRRFRDWLQSVLREDEARIKPKPTLAPCKFLSDPLPRCVTDPILPKTTSTTNNRRQRPASRVEQPLTAGSSNNQTWADVCDGPSKVVRPVKGRVFISSLHGALPGMLSGEGSAGRFPHLRRLPAKAQSRMVNQT